MADEVATPETDSTAATAAPPDATATASTVAAQTPDALNKVIADRLLDRTNASKRIRRSKFPTWKRNVENRVGRTPSIYSAGERLNEDEDRSEINPDWSLTKTKTANLYSQVPVVSGTHEVKQYEPAVPPLTKALNYEIGDKRANIGVPMEEVLNDVVNAAGIGAVIVGYAARFDDVQVPAVDVSQIPPQALPQAIAQGLIPMTTASRVVSDKFFVTRISPVDLLVPADFTGSNFDDGDFVGFTGKKSWADAKNDWNLTDQDHEQMVESGDVRRDKTLRADGDETSLTQVEVVRYDELYYWRSRVDPNEKCFDCIWKLVYVHGKTEPVVHEQWKGQQLVPGVQKKTYIGARRFPVRILTLTYISDNAIPPSDSEAGRPQVTDMRRSRSDMFKNRKFSTPLRWADVNRIDPLTLDLLQRGAYQGIIPTNGDGSRAVGEIARASYPSENMAFDQQAQADLMESWQIGPNQLGMMTPGRKTEAEVNTTQASFATRIGQERNRVAMFFLGICDVMLGLMVLYSDFPNLTDDEHKQMASAWNSKQVMHDLVLKIRPDSTIVLDSQQRIQRLSQFLNLSVKSGYVNPLPIITEMAELSGLDPAEVITQPQPKPLDPPNLSFSFNGKDDLVNPAAMAILIARGQAPTMDQINQAKTLLAAMIMPPQPPAPGPAGMPGPGGPAGAPGVPPPTPGAPAGPVPTAPQGPPAGLPDAHPDWQLGNRIAKRSRDTNG